MSNVMTGAKAVVKLNSLVIGWVSDVSVEHTYQTEEIAQLDSIEVAEHAYAAVRVSVSFGVFKPNSGGGIAQFGLDPQKSDHILAREEVVLEVFDGTTNKLAYIAEGCTFAGGSGALSARGLWQGRWQFKARRGRGV